MPGGDRTGPMGMGPMTGRRAGHCAGCATPGFVNGPGRGFGGGGRGRGRGRRNTFYATGVPGWQRAAWGGPAFGLGVWANAPGGAVAAPPTMTRDQELDVLRQQAQSLTGTLEEIRRRIDELDAQGETE